ncbi:MAG: helix-turn-helix domain-containing protein [Elusimicrobiaceae bacterium]|jgi:SOS-response transcriptional repressor LexA|nr:helix-turn-helix domain-containing protein [Elusimicrobiaceae bacterium]MBT3955534.1 helix-turn-helix domain-containing protein [Elusimicrobiaceae bacterium]MBT4008161.1 helix-turn-helix domain-containing protein [Elusimicrobiaceae bacterium]MBT4402539.1 helix-turn-helix domain-containing protein [Elusimicrobiaceae bacterium]MBT4439666.1 helix-turn-helix domain-containing protein [Elusimicrobiaceae bacterium]
MKLGEKIELLLNKTSMTKVELAKKLGLKDSSVVSHWVKNRFKPEKENVVKLSHVFEKPVTYFANDKDNYECGDPKEMENLEKKLYEALITTEDKAKNINVLSEISEEPFYLSLDCLPEEILSLMIDKDAFAVKATKNLSFAEAGEYIIISKTKDINSGKIMLVNIDDDYSFRKVIIKKKEVMFSYKKAGKFKVEKAKTGSYEIVGQVIGTFKKL